MALYKMKKLAAFIVFNFLILLTVTSVCNAQGYQNQGYQNQGYQNQGYQDQGYQDQGYQDQGYQDQGYQDQGYQDQGYQDQGYQDQGYQDQGYQDQGYQDQGYQDQGYQDQGYQDQGYQDQGYQDSEWLDSSQSYLPTLRTDITLCENAYKNNDMSSLSKYGSKMYNDCYNALEKSKPYKVSYKYTQIKTTYETCIYYYGLAGYYYNQNDYQKANDYMDKGKDSLSSFKKLAAEL